MSIYIYFINNIVCIGDTFFVNVDTFTWQIFAYAYNGGGGKG